MASGRSFQSRRESFVATSKLFSLNDEPCGLSVASCGTMMKVGDARKASRIASATSADVCVWVRLLNRMKLVTSASVSGRRNALRPNVLMVSVRQLAWAASQVMNFAFAAALPMTWLAINPAALRYPFQVTSVRLPSESAPIRVSTSAPGVMPNRLLITVAYWTFVSRGI
jgi:hypothetical protein